MGSGGSGGRRGESGEGVQIFDVEDDDCVICIDDDGDDEGQIGRDGKSAKNSNCALANRTGNSRGRAAWGNALGGAAVTNLDQPVPGLREGGQKKRRMGMICACTHDCARAHAPMPQKDACTSTSTFIEISTLALSQSYTQTYAEEAEEDLQGRSSRAAKQAAGGGDGGVGGGAIVLSDSDDQNERSAGSTRARISTEHKTSGDGVGNRHGRRRAHWREVCAGVKDNVEGRGFWGGSSASLFALACANAHAVVDTLQEDEALARRLAEEEEAMARGVRADGGCGHADARPGEIAAHWDKVDLEYQAALAEVWHVLVYDTCMCPSATEGHDTCMCPYDTYMLPLCTTHACALTTHACALTTHACALPPRACVHGVWVHRCARFCSRCARVCLFLGVIVVGACVCLLMRTCLFVLVWVFVVGVRVCLGVRVRLFRVRICLRPCKHTNTLHARACMYAGSGDRGEGTGGGRCREEEASETEV